MQQPPTQGQTVAKPALETGYEFATQAEADATYLVIAWFAITESASLGIFPLLSALETARQHDPAYFGRFFEQSFQHFTDEQHHANLWCRALLDFTDRYPEVVRRVALPRQYMQIMLKSIGKPHSVLSFSVDCLAFEVVMQALYEVMQPRLTYPPVAKIMQIIMQDEVAHTSFGRTNLKTSLIRPQTRWQKLTVAFRYWRSTSGVLITIGPLLKALSKHRSLAPHEFQHKLALYSRDTGILGSQHLIPNLLSRL